MHRRDFLTAACALSAASTFGIVDTARADGSAGKTVLRVATLAPKGSSWMRVFGAWNNTLKERTQGKLGFHFYPGGAAGDERDVVRKMRAGQIDAAAVTTVGLGQIVRSVLVLQAPGVCHSYRRIDAVRRKLAAEFDREFDRAGYKLLGWGDAGQGRLFSNRPILTPEDMRQTRIWRWRDDPTWQAVLDAAGANGVALGLPEVYPALRAGKGSIRLEISRSIWLRRRPDDGVIDLGGVGELPGSLVCKRDKLEFPRGSDNDLRVFDIREKGRPDIPEILSRRVVRFDRIPSAANDV